MYKAPAAFLGVGGRPALLIVAHPDDECMFFGPTVRVLQSCHRPIHVLCLSTGDAAPQRVGERRTTELKHSCSVMGVPWSRVRVMDDARLQDGMQSVWEPEVVAEVVAQAIKDFSLVSKGIHGNEQGSLTVITFDAYGVSNHANHRSVYHGVRHWQEEQKRRKGDLGPGYVEVFALHSSTLLIKYIGCFSWLVEPFVWWLRNTWRRSPRDHSIACWNPDVARVWRAMACHRSQLTWWRVLFVFLSQYSTLNRLVRI